MCYNRRTLRNENRTANNDNYLNTFPCGKCVRCINKKRTEWAFRMDQESKDHATAYFVTLTYTEENLPYLNLETGQYPVRLNSDITELREDDYLEAIVYKKDIQDFIKNVRRQTEHFVNKHDYTKSHRNYNWATEDQKPYWKQLRSQVHEPYLIRYYFSSEYGTKSTKRPHYHGILWNLQPPIARKLELQQIWKKGNVMITPIDDSIGTYYYLTKYLFKQRNYDIWSFKPFQLMSQKPFIGHRYLETSRDYHIGKGNLITKFNRRDIVLPRIYADRLPKYLQEETRKYLEEQRHLLQDENDRKDATGKNHPTYLLEWFKQQRAEAEAAHEDFLFQQKFKKHEYIH